MRIQTLNKEVRNMTYTYNNTSNIYIKADEIRKIMGISRAYSYKIVKQLNDELESKGYIIVPGRTSRQYFTERLVYGKGC